MRPAALAVFAFAISLAMAGPAAAGAANDIVVFDDFEDGALDDTEWESGHLDGIEIENGRLTVEGGRTVGSGWLKLPDPPTKPNLTFTVSGVDLSGGGRHLRAVGLRVRRSSATESVVVYGVLRVYCTDRAGEQTRAELLLGIVGGDPPVVADASAVPLDGSENLELSLTGATAQLAFGTASASIDNVGVESGDIRLCRVELHGDTALGARPSIDEIRAQSNP